MNASIGFALRFAEPLNGFSVSFVRNFIDSSTGGGFVFLVAVCFIFIETKQATIIGDWESSVVQFFTYNRLDLDCAQLETIYCILDSYDSNRIEFSRIEGLSFPCLRSEWISVDLGLYVDFFC